MKEIKKIRIVAIVAFLIAIASLSISYSSLNTTKEVKGLAIVEKKVVSIKIEKIANLLSDELSTIDEGIIVDGTITYNCNLNTIGSFCSFDFNILNDGSYDIVLKEIMIDNIPEGNNVTYEVTGFNENDILKVQESKTVNVKLIYNDYVRDENALVPVVSLNDIKIKVDFEKNNIEG